MQDFLSSFLTQITQTSILEWVATITGFLCVYLAAKQNIWNWPISIISVGLYLYIFYHSKLYGDSILQIYFLSTAFYGWYYWNKNAHSNDKPIRALSPLQYSYVAAAILLLSILIGSLLDHYTDSDVPYADGFCTAVSFTAQYLMTRKILQNWLLWVFVDICYIPLYIHKNLLLTAILYFVFSIIAAKGYIDWRKTYNLSTKHA